MKSPPLWFTEPLARDGEMALRLGRVLLRERTRRSDLLAAEAGRFGRLFARDGRILWCEVPVARFVRHLWTRFPPPPLRLRLLGDAALGLIPHLLRDSRLESLEIEPEDPDLPELLSPFLHPLGFPPARGLPRLPHGSPFRGSLAYPAKEGLEGKMGLFPGEARSIGNTGPPSVFSGVSPVGPGQPEDGADKFLLWLFPPYPIGAGCDAIERAFAGPLRGAAVLLDASAKPFEVHALEKLLCSRFGGIRRIRVPSPRLPWFFDRWVGSVPSS